MKHVEVGRHNLWVHASRHELAIKTALFYLSDAQFTRLGTTFMCRVDGTEYGVIVNDTTLRQLRIVTPHAMPSM